MFKISGEMTIYQAAGLMAELLAALEDCGGVLQIDLAEVTEFDSAGLQVLMLARRGALARGVELRLFAPSPAVVEVFGLLNVAAYFAGPTDVIAST
jgi:anti-sigma B factor antagonist